MEGGSLTRQAPTLLLVQARVFEAVASTSLLAGPIHELARQFGVTPSTFMDCLGELVHAGWVSVDSHPESIFTIQLDQDDRVRA